MVTDTIGLVRRLSGVALLALVVAVSAAASAQAASRGSLVVTTTGLPGGQPPSVLLSGRSTHRVISSQHVALRGLRPGHYLLTVRPIIVRHGSHAVHSGATALPAVRGVSVTIRAGQTARAAVAYGSIINRGVRSVPRGLLSVSGNPEDPTALVFSGHSKLPAVGTILTSGPTPLLPAGLISDVTRTSHQHRRFVVAVVSVPVTDAVPELSFTGSLQLKPVHGAAQEAGSTIPAQTASVPRAHPANACGISVSSSLLQFGAHLDSVELREAFIGAWPPQLKLTLAVRTSETLGLGLLSAGLNCSWTLAEIGPFDEAVPVGPLLIPVYATFPLNIKLSLNGSAQAGSINVASTTVAHVAAGFDENAASLSEQGTNVWSTGPSVSGSASLAATIGVQAGIGIAKAANLHVEAAFGPEFDASTGQGCDLHIDLGSLSAGTEVLGRSLNTPAFTPFKIPLWRGCKSAGGGGEGGGGGGGGGGGSGGAGGGGGTGGGAPEPADTCKLPVPTPTSITLAPNYEARSFPLNAEGKPFECGTVGAGIAGDRLFLEEPRVWMDGSEELESYTWAYEELATGVVRELPSYLTAVSDNGEYAASGRMVYKISEPTDTWTAPFPTEITGGTEYSEIAAISNDGATVVYWAQGEKGNKESEAGTFLFVAHRGDPTPELLSEGPKPWSFSASISGDGHYIVWHDDGGTDEYPRILDTVTRERSNLTEESEGVDESPIISSDGERILLVDFFGQAHLEGRKTGKIAALPHPITGLNSELTYLITYSGDYACPSSLNRYDVATGEEEPVALASPAECSLSRGPGFGAPSLLIANNGEEFVWNTLTRAISSDMNERTDAYLVKRLGP